MTIPEATIDELAERAAAIVIAKLEAQPKSKYLTAQEAADEILCCSRDRVYDLLALGRLTKYHDGGRVLLLREEVEQYVERTASRAA